MQRTKCTDDAVWERYRATLETNMLHDLCKTVLQCRSDLLNTASTIANNVAHLKTHDRDDAKMMAAMY